MQPKSFPNTTGKWLLSIRWHAKEHVSISATSRRRIQTPWKAGLTSRCILGSKLFYPSVVGAGFRSLSHRVSMAFNGTGIWSVAELNRLVLFDLSRHAFLS
jgi:hypothetical protein